jgi:ATP-binding cassette, subfamily B, bacterial
MSAIFDGDGDEPDVFAPRPYRQDMRQAMRMGPLVLRLAWQSCPRLLLLLIALLALQAVLAPLELVLSRGLIDRAALDAGLGGVPDPLAARLSLGTWAALAALGIVAGQLLGPLIQTCHDLAGDRLTAYVGGALIRAANRWQGLARFEDPGFANDLARARKNASTVGLDLMVNGTWTLAALFTAIGLVVVCAGLSPLMPVVVILATLPSLSRQLHASHRVNGMLYHQTPESRLLEYCREVVLTPQPAKDVRLYDLVPYFHARYEAMLDRTAGEVDRVRRRLLGSLTAGQLLAAGAGAAVYVTVVWLVAHGQRPVGDLALYGGAATLLQGKVREIGVVLDFMPVTFHMVPSLFRVLDAPADLPQPTQPRPAPRPIRDGIVFEGVTFCYPGQSTPVLRDLSLQLRPRESVALVGLNGAGKTTIVKLLLRLYDPTAGRILLDGVDLRDYDLADLRHEMGAIFQDFVCYELTAAENIGLGRLEALHDRSRLEGAAASARADVLLASLPKGLDTNLGRSFGGRDLSGGEWQKLALARAFLRDGQVLVLDEPTAALDVQTEYEVYRHFQELTRGRLTLLISHRFSTVRMADRILYLADGCVQEAGAHDVLLALDGAYARLFRMQAAQYADDS